ncbi:histone-lysine N-methyltransferase SETMAR [Trichonephila clavipes]|nr:histone-lysine N-methyltransferase SETMAR [Trichonephila clavipes]
MRGAGLEFRTFPTRAVHIQQTEVPFCGTENICWVERKLNTADDSWNARRVCVVSSGSRPHQHAAGRQLPSRATAAAPSHCGCAETIVHPRVESGSSKVLSKSQRPDLWVSFEKHSPAPVIENVDKIKEIIEVDWHVNSCRIAQELKIDHKTVLSHLSKVGFKKKLEVWVPHQLTPINMMDRISICEALDKRNEIDPFLKQMVTGDEKWVTYDNIVR